MQIETRNRAELKSYFLKNKIPTETHFADLINAMINQREDGLVKLPGSPLSIQSEGTANSENRIINFYRDFNATNPDWTISLNPVVANTARAGFGINDGQGNNRFFIDASTGQVGIGTNAPVTKLDVRGTLKAEGFGIGVDNPQQKLVISAPHNTGKESDNSLTYSGHIAIISTAPQIDFLDTDAAHKDWAIHVNSGRMYFIAQPWVDTGLVLGSTGNVGIGVTNAQQKLVVSGSTRGSKEAESGLSNAGTMAIKSEEPQLDFIDTSTDAAHKDWAIHVNQGRMYFIRQPWEHTDLVLDGPTGRIGMGVVTPEHKLTVNGYLASRQVYFSAYVEANNRSGTLDPLPMQVVSQNVGEAYNTSSSKFKAPVTGVYLFTMTGFRVSETTNGDLNWFLMVNGVHANSGSGGETNERCVLTWYSGQYGTGSRTLIVRLKAEDLVHIMQVGIGRVDNFRSGLEGILISAIDSQL